MHHPIRRFYSDSDDDRPSSSESITSASQCAREPQLPSSLRKLLNPVLPSPSPLPVRSQANNLSQAPLARICLAKKEYQEKGDLTRLRPWKRLPLPRPLNPQPPVSLPPIYLCIPTSHAVTCSPGSCSTTSPQFSPYYLPAPRVFRERLARVSHIPAPPQIEKPHQFPDQPLCSPTSPPTILNQCSIAGANNREANARNKIHLDLSLNGPTCGKPATPAAQKNFNHSQEKERNRCLTCGSSFSTFANLTRHEKKCPVDSKKVTF
ncbi:hypothetical protein PCANC_05821 [Puccinia coronata f. sp. avenae]|uniref:C2H2-type domain-containing protein n=1 Tax=Puccinia coronata f. sp. avenae TaxID=200324 RepID=A0A2N5V5J9_9BASI|nr:hypothetical protein PCASD_03994 [Puccinia coronata f. sp. avenae]PLW53098.1 hypothetical protein PCANC_05821 [Puccinia coronata f. sp. avenae]